MLYDRAVNEAAGILYPPPSFSVPATIYTLFLARVCMLNGSREEKPFLRDLLLLSFFFLLPFLLSLFSMYILFLECTLEVSVCLGV